MAKNLTEVTSCSLNLLRTSGLIEDGCVCVCVFKVSRITATSHSLSMSLTLDIANELYPVEQSETFTLTLARSLVPSELEALDNNAGGDEGEDGSEVRRVKRELWRSNEQGLAEDYDYVMYGKVG